MNIAGLIASYALVATVGELSAGMDHRYVVALAFFAGALAYHVLERLR